MGERTMGQLIAGCLALVALATASCTRLPSAPSPIVHRKPAPDVLVSRIALGSCLQQRRPAPALVAMAALRPDVVLLLGDNVYADTDDPRRMREAYAELAANPDYRQLVAAAPILAVWDDHDYGANDAGAEWAMKHAAKRILLDFFDESPDSPRWQRDGIYDARILGPAGRRVQIVLLDTRWFRSPLRREGQAYVPVRDPKATILGAAQWAWLETQLRVPAEVRIVVSSIQVLPEEHRFEKWANIPAERERLLEVLRSADARATIIVSGDRHRGELSALASADGGQPLYELTASSLNAAISGSEPNRLRVGPLVTEANFGTIDFAWDAAPPEVVLRLHDMHGAVLVEQRLALAAAGAP